MSGEKIDRGELLQRIAANSGPERLDLSDCDLSNIDLSQATIQAEVEQRQCDPETTRWITVDDHEQPRMNMKRIILNHSDLTFAKLQGADMYRSELRDANLARANLEGAQLEWAELQGSTLTGGASLANTLLTRTNLERAELTGARLDGAIWYGAFLERSRVTRRQLEPAIQDEINANVAKAPGAYHQASDAYLNHKNNFISLGRHEDAAWAYVKEQQMEKMAFYWEWRRHRWRIWKDSVPFGRWLRNWIYELLTGYGERPMNPAIGGGLIIAGFAVGYYAAGSVNSFWDALAYSLATFATFNLADLQPEGRGVDIASSVEALLGIAILALVVFTLGNRMSRS